MIEANAWKCSSDSAENKKIRNNQPEIRTNQPEITTNQPEIRTNRPEIRKILDAN